MSRSKESKRERPPARSKRVKKVTAEVQAAFALTCCFALGLP
jgi:hypothetical protein